jgi:spore maturation protein CgeB
MNILFIYPDDNSLMYSWPKVHYFDELKRAGHIIFIFNPKHYSCIDEANEQLLVLTKENKEKYDLLVCLHGDDVIYRKILIEIKSTGIPTLLICFDNLHTPYIHRKIAPLFDLVWLTSFETKHIFEKWNCNCIFLPYAANPYSFKPYFAEEINAVGFIGTPYGTRINKINDLIDNDVPFTVYSDKILINNPGQREQSFKKNNRKLIKISKYDFTAWRFGIGRQILWSKVVKKFTPQPASLSDSPFLKIHSSVSSEEMNRLYSSFSLSLNITEVWDTYVLKKPVHKLHLRTFEIPMCGGLQFAPYIEELAGYFEEDKEIVLYKNKNEYIDKAKYYLQDKLHDKRIAMKKAARLRAENEHTWMNRFNKIFDVMNLK